MTIIWIEDDYGFNETLGDWFRFDAGWEVIHATGPQEGLALIEKYQKRVDLILLDIMMPPEDVVDNVKSDYGKDTGLLLIPEINKITGGGIPVVILSARQENLGELAGDSSVKARLNKTIGLEAIVAGIDSILRSERSAR